MTTTAVRTLLTALNSGNIAEIATALQKIAFGTAMNRLSEPLRDTHTLATVADTITLDPPALAVLAVNVSSIVGGAGATGPRWIFDSSASPSATVCTISNDGATLTFEATIKAAVVSYIPRPVADGALDLNVATGGTE